MTPPARPKRRTPRSVLAWIAVETVLLALILWAGPIAALPAVLGAIYFTTAEAITTPARDASVARTLGSLVALVVLAGGGVLALVHFAAPETVRSAFFGWIAVSLALNVGRAVLHRTAGAPLFSFTQTTTTTTVHDCGGAQARR